MAKVRWSGRALICLQEIENYIAQDAPHRAVTFVDELIDAAHRLGSFPYSGAVVPEFGREDIREVLHGQYRIVYRTSPDLCEVIFCAHGSRDLTQHFHPDA